MPVQLIIICEDDALHHNLPFQQQWNALRQQLQPRTLAFAAISSATTPLDLDIRVSPANSDLPWPVFSLMQQTTTYPPSHVLVLCRSQIEIQRAKNAGAWAVGLTDWYEHTTPPPTEAERELVRSRVLDHGADAVIDSLSEVGDAIDALNAMIES